MRKTIATILIGLAAVAPLAGCSAPKTPESVALDFAHAFFADSGKMPSEFMCSGSTAHDADRWFEPATDLEVSKVEKVDSSGKQRIWVDYLRPSGGEGHFIATVDVRDLCVSAAQ